MSDTTSTGWKYKLGLVLFIVPIITFILIPIVIPMLDLTAVQTASVIGAVLLTGEVVWFASIPLLGKDGFIAIKQKMFGWLKVAEKPKSKQQHYFALILLFGSLFVDIIVQIIIVVSNIVTDKGNLPLPDMSLDEHINIYTTIQIATTAGIIIAIFLLGSQFWEKIKQAFLWEPSP